MIPFPIIISFLVGLVVTYFTVKNAGNKDNTIGMQITRGIIIALGGFMGVVIFIIGWLFTIFN